MPRPSRPASQKTMPIRPQMRRPAALARTPAHASGSQPLSNRVIQKVQDKGSLTPNDVATLQRTMGNHVVQRLLDEQEITPAKSAGESASRPLPVDVRAKMERSFGTSFGDVRIHQGAQADAMGARAYAQGSNIYVQRSINVNGYEGQKVLAHELAHVVQQRTGRVPNANGGAANEGAINEDPHLETEAHRAANKAANGAPVALTGGTATVQRAPTNVVQRWPKWLKKAFSTSEEKKQARRQKKEDRKRQKQEKKEARKAQAQLLNQNEFNPEFSGMRKEYMLDTFDEMGF